MPIPIGILPQTPSPFDETTQSIQGILQSLKQQRQGATLGRVTQDPEAANLYALAGNDPQKFQQLLALRNIASPNPNLTPEQIEAQRTLAAQTGRGSAFNLDDRLKLASGQSDIRQGEVRSIRDIQKGEPEDRDAITHAKSVDTTIKQLRQIVEDPKSNVSQPIASQIASSLFGEGSDAYKAITSARGQGAAFQALTKNLLLKSGLPKGARLNQKITNLLGNAVPAFGNSKAGQSLILDTLDLANQQRRNEALARRQAIADYRKETGNPSAVPPDLFERQERIFNQINRPVEDRLAESIPVSTVFNEVIGSVRGSAKTKRERGELIKNNIQNVISSTRRATGSDNPSILLVAGRQYASLIGNNKKYLDPALAPEGAIIGEPFKFRGKNYAIRHLFSNLDGHKYVTEEISDDEIKDLVEFKKG